tara:strand:- start:259 stop:1134 length:876 start_codon:yes stop_codon:yes gene_type:complete
MANNTNKKINKILVVGLGLIGASLCRTLKNNSNYEKIFGHDCDKEVMQYALENNFIDETKINLKNGIQDSDLIVLCVPIHQIKKILDIIKEFFDSEKIFTDTLSVKNSILDFMDNNKFGKTDNFILSHPMAGTENFGIKNSNDNLFLNSVTLISPLDFSNLDNVNAVKDFWKSVNCNIVEVDPYDHDRHLAAISHSPHLISFALSKIINDLEYEKEFPWIHSKGSLSDMTRIANSEPEAWASIFKDNQENIIDFIDEYLGELNELKARIMIDDQHEFDDLVSYLKNSKPVK